MNRFEYEEGDLEFDDSQCSLCIYYNQSEKKCRLFGNIPPEIISDEVTCDKFEYKDEEDA